MRELFIRQCSGEIDNYGCQFIPSKLQTILTRCYRNLNILIFPFEIKMRIIIWFVFLLSSYLLGAIPCGYLLTRWFHHFDIRERGSGNIGFTNVLRSAGPATAAFTLLLDGAKGWAAVALLAPAAFNQLGGSLEIYQISASLLVVGGHIFSVFLGFRGGKGVASGAGVLLAISPPAFFFSLLIWVLLVICFRYISLASLVVVILLPLMIYGEGQGPAATAFFALFALLIIVKHTGNLRRLIAGREYKIGEKAVLSNPGHSQTKNV